MTTFLKHPPKGPSLRDLYTRPLVYGTSPASLRWADDGTRLAFLWNEGGEPLLDLYVTDGDKLLRVSDAASVAPLPVEDDERSSEEIAYAAGMATGVSEFDWLGNDLVYAVKGNLFRVAASGGGGKRMTCSSQGWSGIQAAPDGTRVGFLLGGNLWTYDVTDGRLSQITFFSRELVAVTSFGWSPDSTRFWVVVEDTSMYERVKMPDYSPEKEVKIAELRRNNVGKPLAKIRLGIVSTAGGKIARVKLESDATAGEGEIDTGAEVCFHGARWTCDGQKLIAAYADKNYVDYRIVTVTPGSEDAPHEIFRKRMEPWADWIAPQCTPDSRFVCFNCYLAGWRRIYRLSIDGGDPVPLTPDGQDAGVFIIPKRGSRIIYTAHHPHPTEQQVFSIPLEGGEPERLTTEGTWSDPVVSHDGQRVAILTAGVMEPAELYWPAPDGLKRLTHSPISAFQKLRRSRVERIAFTNEEDGATIHAKTIFPADFDPAKKYPVVLSCIYAGQGKEFFGRYQVLDNYMANEMGYIVVGIDLRASAGHGRDFYFGYHKKLGLIDAGECVSCAKYLKTLPYVDAERIGLWGGSYGGFLTLMAMCNHPGVFHTGVSWKPVTDWRNYWDGYTCPRLGRPQDDPEVFRATSPVFHADGLQDNLLIIHGLQDDNVLFQDAAWMIQKLIEAKKYFDLMIYPRDDHGLYLRRESLPDCMERIAAYFEEHMGLGPV
jgi:dipeptidyl-peptidase 4